MAYKVKNISSSFSQKLNLVTPTGVVRMHLKFHKSVGIWTMDLEYQGKVAKGVKLSAYVPLVQSFNFPFDFYVMIKRDQKLDPCIAEDFVKGYVELWFLDEEDKKELEMGSI